MFDEKVELNQYDTNAKIKGHILSDEKMYALGFNKNYYEGTRFEEYAPYWYKLDIAVEDRYSNITFDVRIYKDTEEVEIMVLDEEFGQPYDYQHMLHKDPTREYPLRVYRSVENKMKILQDAGVLSGHVAGEYI